MRKAPNKLRVLSETHGALAAAGSYDDKTMLDDGSFLIGVAVALAWTLGDSQTSPVEWLGRFGARVR